MDPQQSAEIPAKTGSRLIYWLIAVFIVLLVAGVAAWFYLNSQQTAPVAETPASTQTVAQDPVLTAGADVDATVTDLDAELTAIDEDLNSNDDDAPTL